MMMMMIWNLANPHPLEYEATTWTTAAQRLMNDALNLQHVHL
jgi:hypothetical protein